MNSIKYGTILLLLLGLSVQTYAQKMHRTPAEEHRRPSHMAKLDLTDSQKDQVREISDKYREEMKTLLDNEDITVGEQRKRRKTLADKKDAEIMAVLDDNQKKTFQEMIDSRPTREEMEQRREEREKTREEIRKIKDDESLSKEEKKEKLEKMREDRGVRMNRMNQGKRRSVGSREPRLGDRQRAVPQGLRYDIMEELDLNTEQKAQIEKMQQDFRLEVDEIKKSDQTQDEKRIAIKELSQLQRDKISSVLTEEQKMKFKELVKQNRPRR